MPHNITKTILFDKEYNFFTPVADDGAINAGKCTAECIYWYLKDITPCTLLDLGANAGATSCILASILPQLTVHAYEPHPDIYECLVENVREYGLQGRVYPHNEAVGKAEYLQAAMPERNSGTSVTSKQWTASSIRITSKSLDGIIKLVGFCDVIKMDIEGAEYEVLADFTLWDMFGKLHMETHEPLITHEECERLGMQNIYFGPASGIHEYVCKKMGLTYLTRGKRVW